MTDALRTALRGLGQLLITAGVVVLLFCVYELQFTGVYTAQEQKKLDTSLLHEWERPAVAQGPVVPVFAPGTAFARIYLPTLGAKQTYVVVEGVTKADLKKGPGHIPGTGYPGQLGNTVISGHRTTYGAPFNRIDELAAGDAIVVETGTAFLTYKVERLTVVKPTRVDVTYPVPGKKDAVPTQSLLTLTTCHPKYSAKSRLIVRAVLDSVLDKGPGVVPPALRTVS